MHNVEWYKMPSSIGVKERQTKSLQDLTPFRLVNKICDVIALALLSKCTFWHYQIAYQVLHSLVESSSVWYLQQLDYSLITDECKCVKKSFKLNANTILLLFIQWYQQSRSFSFWACPQPLRPQPHLILWTRSLVQESTAHLRTMKTASGLGEMTMTFSSCNIFHNVDCHDLSGLAINLSMKKRGRRQTRIHNVGNLLH